MISRTNIITTLLLAAGIAFTAGCKSVPVDQAQTNIAVYNYGEFQGLYNTTASVVTPATRDVMKQIGLLEVALTEKKFSSKIIGRDAKDRKVEIDITEVNSRQTQISIRWGAGGDLKKSRQLYDGVEAIVSGGAPAAHK